MSELLNDQLNLEILDSIISGHGVSVNTNFLSKKYKRHRNTIKEQVNALFKNGILHRPFYPFTYLFKEYSLMVVVRSDLPRNEKIDKFLRENTNIFAAFYVRDEVFNTLMFEFHKDLYAYAQWKKRIVAEREIPPRDIRYPASTMFFSTNEIFKYQPHAPIALMEEKYANGEAVTLNGYKMNGLCFNILRDLMTGDGVRTNENQLSADLNVHRRTIERRISFLMKEKIVSRPVCRFPKFFVPPDHILVYSVMEIKRSKEKIFKAIRSDPHIPIALEASVGRYNLSLFTIFKNVEEHFTWEEEYDARFPDCIGAMKNIYLSPGRTAQIDQQKVSLDIIKKKKEVLHGRTLMESLRDLD